MRLISLSAVCLLVQLLFPSDSMAQWILDMLPVPSTQRPIATSINDRGAVVGHPQASGVLAPFYWTPESGVLQEFADAFSLAWPQDINNRSEVVGILEPFSDHDEGFFWSASTGLVILDIPDAGLFLPSAINDSGAIAGGCMSALGTIGLCIWSNGVLTKIDAPLAGRFPVVQINNAGDVAGGLLAADGRTFRAFYRPDGSALILLDTPPGSCSSGVASLNDAGQIVGNVVMCDGSWHLALWRRDGSLQRTIAGLSAVAINDSGVIVGTTSHAGVSRAFARLPSGHVTFLPGSNPVVTDINARGDISGSVSDGDTSTAVVWRYRPAALHITTPNTSSRWGINTRQRLAWTYTGNATQFAIDFSPEPDMWIQVDIVDNEPGNSQNYYRTVTAPPTTTGRLRVRALGDPDAVDANDADITIASASIGIIYPRPGSTRSVSATERIFYTHNLGARAPVAIDVSGDGGRTWRTVAARAETNGSTTASFYWTVDLTPTTQGMVRVRALDGSRAVGASQLFNVRAAAPGTITETAR